MTELRLTPEAGLESPITSINLPWMSKTQRRKLMCTSIMSLVPNMSQKNPSVLETGPAIADWMEDNTEVRFKPVSLPDYNISKEGASIGRTMLTKEFDGRRLGDRVKKLQCPIQGYSVFGSM